jgi:sugar phosphate isomerase/epimerase
VCSWSLRPESPADLVEKVLACGVRSVQLALDPIRDGRWRCDDVASRLRVAGIRVASGMMACKGEDYSTLDSIRRTGGLRPDDAWEDNLKAAEGDSVLAMRLGIRLVTFHAGFLPEDHADPLRSVMIGRLRQVAEIYASRRVRVAFETGQETAETLEGHLSELAEGGGDAPLPAAYAPGVNFDPANMILYGMGEPVAALRRLAPRVAQIHLKDALPTKTPGEWGTEVPVGQGAVDWPAFFGVVREAGLGCDFMIEREAGSQRIEEVRAARDLATRVLAADEQAVAR